MLLLVIQQDHTQCISFAIDISRKRFVDQLLNTLLGGPAAVGLTLSHF